VRLLTLHGPGGVGKTRLGLQVAAEQGDAFADGVCFVPLAPVQDPPLLATVIASALGIRDTPGEVPLRALKEYLRDKSILLVLDNFEHLLPSASWVAELLAAAPRLKVLVTSRAALRLQGEQEFSVPPLPVPDRRNLPPIAALARNPAVALFLQRAARVQPGFELTTANASAIAGICDYLDGLPLAIELAAARLKLLSPTTMHSWLVATSTPGLPARRSALDLLARGPRDLDQRQRSLRDTIAWSYDLLTEDEKALFQRLSVFVGGCTLAALETVCESDLNTLAALVDLHLVRREADSDGEPRIGMLETIREYGQERLRTSGEEDALRRRHAQFFLELAEASEPGIRSWEGERWLVRLDLEQNNLRAALAWCHQMDDAGEMEQRLVGALWWFWSERGYEVEGYARARAALTRPGTDRTRARALQAAGGLAWLESDMRSAHAYLEESASICRECGDRRGFAYSQMFLAWTALYAGDHATARTMATESLELFTEVGERWGLISATNCLAETASRLGQYEVALPLCEEAVAMARQIGHRLILAWTLANLGTILSAQSDLQRAAAALTESVELMRALRNQPQTAGALNRLGGVARRQGDWDLARSCYEECVSIWQTLGNEAALAHTLNTLDEVLTQQEDQRSR
jgi:predicted ATPase